MGRADGRPRTQALSATHSARGRQRPRRPVERRHRRTTGAASEGGADDPEARADARGTDSAGVCRGGRRRVRPFRCNRCCHRQWRCSGVSGRSSRGWQQWPWGCCSGGVPQIETSCQRSKPSRHTGYNSASSKPKSFYIHVALSPRSSTMLTAQGSLETSGTVPVTTCRSKWSHFRTAATIAIGSLRQALRLL